MAHAVSVAVPRGRAWGTTDNPWARVCSSPRVCGCLLYRLLRKPCEVSAYRGTVASGIADLDLRMARER